MQSVQPERDRRIWPHLPDKRDSLTYLSLLLIRCIRHAYTCITHQARQGDAFEKTIAPGLGDDMSAGSFPLESLRLSSAERSALEKCERSSSARAKALTSFTGKLVSALDILLTPPAELNRRLRNRDLKDTYALVRKVAEAIRPLPRRLNELYAEQRGEARVDGAAADEAESRGPMFLGTGDEGIDQALGGGLRLGSLTEIAGERCVAPDSRGTPS